MASHSFVTLTAPDDEATNEQADSARNQRRVSLGRVGEEEEGADCQTHQRRDANT